LCYTSFLESILTHVNEEDQGSLAFCQIIAPQVIHINQAGHVTRTPQTLTKNGVQIILSAPFAYALEIKRSPAV